MLWLLPWDDENQVRHLPWATYLLIMANIVAYLFAPPVEEGSKWLQAYGLVAADPHWYQFILGNFIHGDPFHLFGNMLFLLVFGDNVEDVFGPLPFLVLYFAGGLAGDLLYVHANPGITMPTIGASGCIATLAGTYLLLFFGEQVGMRVMFFVLPVHSFSLHTFWVILLWFAADVVRTWYGHGVLPSDSGVNFVSHGVGFTVGAWVALVALACGVLRRYRQLLEGHQAFGYWPPSLERRQRGRPGNF
jgi:membrane associated rhomboid family serine protease